MNRKQSGRLALNLPRALCNATIGKHHTVAHRLIGGALIMTGGMAFYWAGTALSSSPVVHFVSEMIGFAIHGLGAVPYVDLVMETDTI